MPVKLTELKGAKVLEVTASGKLTDEDYQQFNFLMGWQETKSIVIT